MPVLRSIVCHRNLLLLLILSVFASAALVWIPSPRNLVDAKETKTPAVQVTNPGIVGEWSTLIPFKTVPLHISLLPNGKLLYWGRDKMTNASTGNVEDVRGGSNTYLVDPAFFFNDPLGHTTTYRNSTTNLFCSGHSFLADGRLLVTGGHDKSEHFPFSEGLGERAVNFFDYRNQTSPWTKHTVGLALGRWYPFNVTMANGNVAIMGGSFWENRADPTATPRTPLNEGPERYTYDPQGQGSLAVYQQDSNPFGRVENYPLVQLAPNGKVLIVGANNRYFDGTDETQNPPEGHFTSYPFAGQQSQPPGDSRFQASSVLYEVTPDNGKVIVMGGNLGAGGTPVNDVNTNVTEFQQAWTPVGRMNFKRKFHTATLLPDGKVMVAGGTQCPGANSLTCSQFPNPNSGGAVIQPEIWNPANPSTWTTMAASPSAIPRLYHSMAMLLPDATVLVGAGGLPGAIGEVDPLTNAGRAFGHKDAEIFSPPYLFNLDGTRAQRPSITWIQDDKIGLGQSMLVKTPEYANITSVVLVRLGSVTHGFNQDQRRVVLTFNNNNLSYPQTLNVTMPPNGKVCPPGPYMMFLLANGVPSMAKMVSIQLDQQTLEPPPPIPPGSTLKSGPAVAQNSDGRLQVFYRGGDDALYTIAQTSPRSSTWTNPISLGGVIAADPVVARGTTGLLEVLVVGAGNRIYYTSQTSPGSTTFTGFTALNGTFSVAGLALHQNADGRLQVFYRRPNNAIWTVAQSAVGSSTWGIQVSLGGSATDSPAVGMLNKYMAVFYRGTDGLLYHAVQTDTNINTWINLGPVLEPVEIESTPTVENFYNSEQLIVFARGARGDLVYVVLRPPAEARWTAESLGGSLILSPGLGANADNNLDAFFLGVDNKLYNTYQTKFGWSEFAQVGGNFSTPLNTSPVTALNANGKLSVFVRGSDNSLYMATQNVAGQSANYSALTRITP